MKNLFERAFLGGAVREYCAMGDPIQVYSQRRLPRSFLVLSPLGSHLDEQLSLRFFHAVKEIRARLNGIGILLKSLS